MTRPSRADGGGRVSLGTPWEGGLGWELSGRAFAVGLAAACALGVALAGLTLAREPLGNDEIASLALVSRSLGSFFADFASSQSAGLLFHAVLWPVVHLAGESATALRLPSLAAFGAAIVVCGLVGARLGGRVVGVSAALLLAVCPFAVLHAQDARMYALAATGLAVVVAALGYGAVQVVRTLDRPDWEGAARYLDARTTDGRRIVFVGGQRNAASFLYYAPRYGVPRDRLPWTQEELDRLPPTLMIIDRDNDVGDLRAALGRLPAWVVEQGALSPGTQERFDRLLDTCETRSRSSFRAISVSLVTRCAPG